MKKIACIVLLFISIVGHAQIEPFPGIVINQNQVTNIWPDDIENYGTITTDGQMILYNYGANKNTVSAAGINLTQGTTVSNINGTTADIKLDTTYKLAWFYPATNSPAEVPKNEHLEVGIQLDSAIEKRIENFVLSKHDSTLNPFDPDQLDVVATFSTWMNGQWVEQGKTYGFYFMPFERSTTTWDSVNTDYHMRIRYTPTEVGLYRCQIKYARNGGNYTEVMPFHFTCVNSSLPGFMKIGANDNYFEVDGNTFYPVGNNLPAPQAQDGSYGQISKPADYRSYLSDLTELKNSGGNYFRFFMGPQSFGLEFEKMNNYSSRLNHAWELDQVLDTMGDLGLKAHLNTMIHFALTNVHSYGARQWDWTRYDDPVYDNALPDCNANTNDLGYCYRNVTGSDDPRVFLTDSTCRVNFKKRYRYIISRWGYCTNIGTIQLISEFGHMWGDPRLYDQTVDLDTVPGNKGYCIPYDSSGTNHYDSLTALNIPQKVEDWNLEMADYIKNELGHHQHLLTASYAGEPKPENGDLTITSDLIDFIDYNNYRKFYDTWYNLYGQNYKYKVDLPLIYSFSNKPVMNSEVCDVGCDNWTTWQKDVLMRPFTGFAGALPWLMSSDNPSMTNPNTVQQRNELWDLFGHVSVFLQNFDLANENWVPQRYVSQDGKFDVVYLHKNQDMYIGAIHNRTWNFFTQWYGNDSIWPEIDSSCYYEGVELGTPYNVADEVIAPIDGLATVYNTAANTDYLVEFYDPFTGGSTSYPTVTWSTITDQGSHYLPFGFPELSADNTMPIVYFVATLQSSSLLAPQEDDTLTPEETIAIIHQWQEENPDEVLKLATKVDLKTESEDYAFETVYQKTEDTWIKAVPNPSSDQVRITIVGANDVKGQYHLMDVNGKEIKGKSFNRNTFDIELNTLPTGMYILFLQTQQKQYQIKIVKK